MYIYICTHVHIHVFKGNFDIYMYMITTCRPSIKGSKLLFPVIKATKIKSQMVLLVCISVMHTHTHIYVYISTCPDSESLLPSAHTSPCYVSVAVNPRLKEEGTAYA